MSATRPQVFVSTGCASTLSANAWARRLLEQEKWGIELSAGAYSPDVEIETVDLAEQTDVMLHNYFPPPRDAFVLNLASNDDEVMRRSRDLVLRALRLSAEVGARHFGVHAGFRVDPRVDSLGRSLTGTLSGKQTEALNRLRESMHLLGTEAVKVGIQLLIENHVLTQQNLEKFGESPLLLVSPFEITQFLTDMDGSVRLLLDLGHLKVSAQTAQFDLLQAVQGLLPLSDGMHLSENDGLSDQHLPFGDDAWFKRYVSDTSKFYTVEVHSRNLHDSLSSARTVATWLSKNLIHD